jgi:hypothetical protein
MGFLGLAFARNKEAATPEPAFITSPDATAAEVARFFKPQGITNDWARSPPRPGPRLTLMWNYNCVLHFNYYHWLYSCGSLADAASDPATHAIGAAAGQPRAAARRKPMCDGTGAVPAVAEWAVRWEPGRLISELRYVVSSFELTGQNAAGMKGEDEGAARK